MADAIALIEREPNLSGASEVERCKFASLVERACVDPNSGSIEEAALGRMAVGVIRSY